VRLAEEARSTVAAIGMLLVDRPDGGHVFLPEVAALGKGAGPSALRRERLSRRVAVEARVQGTSLGEAAAELEGRLRSGLRLPAGYFLEVGGRIEAKARAERALLVSVAVALGLVIVLLYLALGRFSEVRVVVLTLPDAFVGGIVALFLAGVTWNVSSLVGLIGLFGIAVQNGLVLITQTRELLARGRGFEEALREASLRVRPKLLTAGTAILGLLPILLLPGGGTEVERPLAIVMIGGLVTSTLFTLLALPTFYELAHKLAARRHSCDRMRRMRASAAGSAAGPYGPPTSRDRGQWCPVRGPVVATSLAEEETLGTHQHVFSSHATCALACPGAHTAPIIPAAFPRYRTSHCRILCATIERT
jgi:cobalt-zinc-cadmium resistance protein CzcA